MKSPLLISLTCNALAMAGVLVGVIGCSDEAKSSNQSMSSRQNDALQDPFSYGPKLPATQPTKEQKKDDSSLQSEWDRFWNP